MAPLFWPTLYTVIACCCWCWCVAMTTTRVTTSLLGHVTMTTRWTDSVISTAGQSPRGGVYPAQTNRSRALQPMLLSPALGRSSSSSCEMVSSPPVTTHTCSTETSRLARSVTPLAAAVARSIYPSPGPH